MLRLFSLTVRVSVPIQRIQNYKTFRDQPKEAYDEESADLVAALPTERHLYSMIGLVSNSLMSMVAEGGFLDEVAHNGKVIIKLTRSHDKQPITNFEIEARDPYLTSQALITVLLQWYSNHNSSNLEVHHRKETLADFSGLFYQMRTNGTTMHFTHLYHALRDLTDLFPTTLSHQELDSSYAFLYYSVYREYVRIISKDSLEITDIPRGREGSTAVVLNVRAKKGRNSQRLFTLKIYKGHIDRCRNEEAVLTRITQYNSRYAQLTDQTVLYFPI